MYSLLYNVHALLHPCRHSACQRLCQWKTVPGSEPKHHDLSENNSMNTYSIRAMIKAMKRGGSIQ